MNMQSYNRFDDFEKDEFWQTLLDLTHATWRVVDVALESDSFKEKIKQAALSILERYPASAGNEIVRIDVIERIQKILALLSMAQKISIARDINFLILKNEYRKILLGVASVAAIERQQEKQMQTQLPPVPISRQAMQSDAGIVRERSSPEMHRVLHDEKPAEKTRVVHQEKKRPHETLNERQVKILQLFTKRKDDRIKLKDVAQFFPELTDRTIRNDLRDMCMKKIVSRSDGHGQASYYFLNK